MGKRNVKRKNQALVFGLIVEEVLKSGHCTLTDSDFKEIAGLSRSPLWNIIKALKLENKIFSIVEPRQIGAGAKRTILLTSEVKEQLMHIKTA